MLESVTPVSDRADRTLLHKQIIERFVERGWSRERFIAGGQRATEMRGAGILPKSRMKFDLLKERVAIEVQASHVVHCYKDFLKFLVGFNAQEIDVGIEVVFEDNYAKSLGGGSLLTYGKVSRELEDLFRSVIPVPILVIGLEP